jgi:hypothetical protein
MRVIKDAYLDIDIITFIKGLSKFDDYTIQVMLDNGSQGLDELYESIRYREEKLYCESVVQLYKYIEEIKQEEIKPVKYDNPDYEEYLKDPENPTWKELD